jgi:hypothetical protein
LTGGYPLSDPHPEKKLIYTWRYSIESEYWIPFAPRHLNSTRLMSSALNFGSDFAIVTGGNSVGYSEELVFDRHCLSQTVMILDFGILDISYYKRVVFGLKLNFRVQPE